jgi:hypothetical protein
MRRGIIISTAIKMFDKLKISFCYQMMPGHVSERKTILFAVMCNNHFPDAGHWSGTIYGGILPASYC